MRRLISEGTECRCSQRLVGSPEGNRQMREQGGAEQRCDSRGIVALQFLRQIDGLRDVLFEGRLCNRAMIDMEIEVESPGIRRCGCLRSFDMGMDERRHALHQCEQQDHQYVQRAAHRGADSSILSNKRTGSMGMAG